MNKAVFLDRDGTINIEKNYLYKIQDFEFIPGAIDAIRLLKQNGYKVIIATNQAGIARGFYSEGQLQTLHNWLFIRLEEEGAVPDAIYYCPHHSEHGIGTYKVDCTCRKPKAGMLQQAIARFGLHPCASFTIGDKESDIKAGKSAGTTTILVDTGYGSCIKETGADMRAENLLAAVHKIIHV